MDFFDEVLYPESIQVSVNHRLQVEKMCQSKRRELDKENKLLEALVDQTEKIKGSVRDPFRLIKRQFGFTKVCYRGLKKNALQLKMLFGIVRHKLIGAQA